MQDRNIILALTHEYRHPSSAAESETASSDSAEDEKQMLLKIHWIGGRPRAAHNKNRTRRRSQPVRRRLKSAQLRAWSATYCRSGNG